MGLRRDPEARLQAAAAHSACLASFGPDHYRTVEAQHCSTASTVLDRERQPILVAQLLARIVQVLEIENHQFKEANTNLRGQLAAQGAVRDLTRRRRT
ncbi:hypothetical protein GCM10010449_06430 [Streptomyces rectiviolaceus]|uniref:Uncharacterized protein n=1 Tax=Streptomyces rectiviolaceus TaxID=332591 RepID=A0ABP6MA90_9ACTN